MFYFICTFYCSLVASYLYQSHPFSYSNALFYYFIFSIIWNYLFCLLVYLLIQENVSSMSCLFSPLTNSQGLEEDLHIVDIKKKSVLSEYFIFPISSSGQTLCLTQFCIPYSEWAKIMPCMEYSSKNKSWMNIIPVTTSSSWDAYCQLDPKKQKCVFSPHLYSIV